MKNLVNSLDIIVSAPTFIVNNMDDFTALLDLGKAALYFEDDKDSIVQAIAENKGSILNPDEKAFIIAFSGAAADDIKREIIKITKMHAYIIDLSGKNDSIADRAKTNESDLRDFLEAIAENPAQVEANEQSNLKAIDEFYRKINESASIPAIKTGFDNLDAFFDGGIYPGLYLVAAGTSAGKTALVLQLADNIAASGQDILYFSLEMSRFELIARSVSRNTLLLAERKGKLNIAKTARGIMAGYKYNGYSQAERDIIDEAVKLYEKPAEHIFITEGIGDIKISGIKAKIRDYMQSHEGKKPLVIVDYFQLLAPFNDKYSDKQNADKNILELKRLSRDNNISIIAISSINRDNYNEPITLNAIKESGGIEFCCDTVIGLQYSGYERVAGEKEQDRAIRLATLRNENNEKAEGGGAIDIDFKVLKNRNGKRGILQFEYTPMFNRFEEKGKMPFSDRF